MAVTETLMEGRALDRVLWGGSSLAASKDSEPTESLVGAA